MRAGPEHRRHGDGVERGEPGVGREPVGEEPLAPRHTQAEQALAVLGHEVRVGHVTLERAVILKLAGFIAPQRNLCILEIEGIDQAVVVRKPGVLVVNTATGESGGADLVRS